MGQKYEELFKKGAYKELIKLLEQELDIRGKDHPESEELLFYYGSALTAVGEYRKAQNMFTNLFDRTKKYFYIICRALSKIISNDLEGSKADIEEAIEKDESALDLIFAFRVATSALEYEEAEHALLKALEIDSKEALNQLQQFFEEIEGTTQQERIMFVQIMQLLYAVQKEVETD